MAMLKKCKQLWCEAHFEVKMYKKNTRFGPLLDSAMSKKCKALWHEAHVDVKMHKTHQLWTTFGRYDVEKVYAVVAQSTLQVKMLKTPHARTTF